MKKITDILDEMRNSEWYKTAVGADTLQRVRMGDLMPPFEGETIDAWVERTLKEDRAAILDAVRGILREHWVFDEMQHHAHTWHDSQDAMKKIKKLLT